MTLAMELAPHARQMPWWVSAGSRDAVVPCPLTAEGVAALQGVGVPVDLRVYPKDHTIDAARELPDVRAWLAEQLG